MTRRQWTAWAVVAAVAVTAVVGSALELRGLRNDIDVGERLTEAERADGGARHLLIDPDALARLEALIPEDATYEIAIGSEVDAPSPLTVQGIGQLLRYRLLPRRNVDGGGEWVVSYGGDLSLPGAPVDFTVPPFEVVRLRP